MLLFLKTSGHLYIRLFVIAALMQAVFALAQPPMTKRGPVLITSDTLIAESSRAVFEGNVVAKTDDITLKAQKMFVYYTEGNKVQKIEAEGEVRFIRGEKVITSEKGTYLADEEKIILTGEPKAVERENIVTGSRIIYLIKENRSIIENSRVLLKRQEGGQ